MPGFLHEGDWGVGGLTGGWSVDRQQVRGVATAHAQLIIWPGGPIHLSPHVISSGAVNIYHVIKVQSVGGRKSVGDRYCDKIRYTVELV